MSETQGKTRVTILTGAYRIKGYIDLIPGARLTDFIVEAKSFVAVTDVEVWELHLGGRQILAANFIDVSKDHIQIVMPG
ncbi:unnamed protein product [Phaeothamnion confervicola]